MTSPGRGRKWFQRNSRVLHRHGDLGPIGAQRPEIDDLSAVCVDHPYCLAGVEPDGAAVASRDRDAGHETSK